MGAQRASGGDAGRRTADGRDWQRPDGGFGGYGGGDEERPAGVARKRMRRPPGVGDGGPGKDAGSRQAINHSRQHGLFAAMQMIGAGRIEDDPVGQIGGDDRGVALQAPRSEEHTSELQSLMRTSYAVFCSKQKKHRTHLMSLLR